MIIIMIIIVICIVLKKMNLGGLLPSGLGLLSGKRPGKAGFPHRGQRREIHTANLRTKILNFGGFDST